MGYISKKKFLRLGRGYRYVASRAARLTGDGTQLAMTVGASVHGAIFSRPMEIEWKRYSRTTKYVEPREPGKGK